MKETYTAHDLLNLKNFYSDQLLNNTIPFWFPSSFDETHGGFLLMKNRDGSLIDDDKAVWIQGRATWMLSTLFNTVEKKPIWLHGAKLGYQFLTEKCFDTDGQMFFHVTREGQPIRKRRYFFSETFATIGAAALAKATASEEIAAKAKELLFTCIDYASGKKTLPPKYTNTRPSKGIGVPMIMINTARQYIDNTGDISVLPYINQWVEEIETLFVKHDIQCVMEQLAPDGSIIDHIDGRTLNPGHAIEGAWFIMWEGVLQQNEHYKQLGCTMLDYMWERGWDKQYGGLLYFTDVKGMPVQEYWQDMKFWWPHNETIIATLLAYLITGNPKYAQWHHQVHTWAYNHFLDKEHGEWFGYLHRDGTIAQPAKGNLFKGPFHLPRQEWFCYKLLEQYLDAPPPGLL